MEAEIEPLIEQLKQPHIQDGQIIELCNLLYEKLDSGNCRFNLFTTFYLGLLYRQTVLVLYPV